MKHMTIVSIENVYIEHAKPEKSTPPMADIKMYPAIC